MKQIIACFACISMLWIATLSITANTKERAALAKCVDGDTTHFTIEGRDVTVRYLAIDAPEYTKEKEAFGKEASDYVCRILTEAKEIELEYDDGSDRLDKYGRSLAWVYADGKLLQKELVAQGLAEVRYIYGEYAYTAELKTAQEIAEQEKRNMWSDERQESTTSKYQLLTGVILVCIGAVFVKGKRSQQKWIKKGIKKIRNSK